MNEGYASPGALPGSTDSHNMRCCVHCGPIRFRLALGLALVLAVLTMSGCVWCLLGKDGLQLPQDAPKVMSGLVSLGKRACE